MNTLVTARQISAALVKLGNPAMADHAQRYFKTGRGEYGEGDRFLGIRVPALRRCAREYSRIPVAEAFRLLESPLHEARLLALFILVRQYAAAKTGAAREAIYRGYLARTRHINNWDLVDSSAPRIVGCHLLARDRRPLYRLARSRSLWERRIGIMATAWFIKENDFSDTLLMAKILLEDREDLIHKAVGWMLREVGNRDRNAEKAFLDTHLPRMPRTMLRYAIEKFPEPERQAYLRR